MSVTYTAVLEISKEQAVLALRWFLDDTRMPALARSVADHRKHRLPDDLNRWHHQDDGHKKAAR